LIRLRSTVDVHVDAARQPVRVDCGEHEQYYAEAIRFSPQAYKRPVPSDADVAR
jgi:hypothetical protein